MNNKKLVFNNEQYNILTSIKLGQTAFLICIDLLDKKVIYFKQEVVDGKVKLTSPANIVVNASEVNKKSLSNKKRLIEAFIPKIHLGLANAMFVDHKKVADAFHNFTSEIDNCDLKYYMIENASIEETDEQIDNFIIKFNGLDFSKDLNQVNEIKNELYYFSTNEEEVKTKEESVSNVNRIETTTNNSEEVDNNYIGPAVANNPLNDNTAFNTDLTINQSIDAALNKHLEEYAPKKDIEVSDEQRAKNKRTNTIIIVAVLLIAVGAIFFTFFNKKKTYTTTEIMEKVNSKSSLKEVEGGKNYNAPDEATDNYYKALNSKFINVNVNALKSINSDTIGWISNNYLKINYPIVKGGYNGYYSSRDFMKDNSEGGWIYLDSNTDLNKIDRNNVIYGKSNISATFFYYLKNVLTPDYVKDINNQVIKISTEDADTLWLVFSIYQIPNEDYYLKNDFKDDAEYIDFLNTVNERSVHNFEVDLDEYDKILTLTTNKDNDNRIVVHAKLIKINSRVQEDEKETEVKEEKKDEKVEDKKEDETTDNNILEQPTNNEENKKSDN